MERVWGHVIRGFVLVAGLGAAAGLVPACVHDNSTIFVSDVLAPPTVTSGMSCTFTADPTQPVLGTGRLDVALAAEYTAVFLLGNQLVPQADPNQPHTETSFVTIEGAVVRVVDSTGKQLSTYTQPAAVTIPPSSGTTPGYASLGATIVDSNTTKLLIPMFANVGSIPIVSYVRFFGHTLGGESVETNEFGFPINVCLGCLINFPIAEDNPEQGLPQPNCLFGGASMTSTTTTSSASTSVPCFVGQEVPIDCSLCAAIDPTNPFCRVKGGQPLPTIVDAGGGGG